MRYLVLLSALIFTTSWAFAQAAAPALPAASIFGSAWTFIVTYVPLVVTAAAAAAAVLPQGKAGGVWDTVRTIINWAAFNWGNAKNIVQNP